MYIKQSFLPLECDEASVLILGSIPGDRSLELGQYYGHPQNRFWRMVATITGSPISTDYEDKKAMLAKSRIALWDVAHQANRKGSMDSAIRDEKPNAVNDYLTANPNIRTVAFNGKKAEQLYDKYFERQPNIQYISLPSTSPANAACGFEKLCKKWDILKR